MVAALQPGGELVFEPSHFMVELINICAITIFALSLPMLIWALLGSAGVVRWPAGHDNRWEPVIGFSLATCAAVALFFAYPEQKIELLLGGMVVGNGLPWIYSNWQKQNWVTVAVAVPLTAIGFMLLVYGLTGFVV